MDAEGFVYGVFLREGVFPLLQKILGGCTVSSIGDAGAAGVKSETAVGFVVGMNGAAAWTVGVKRAGICFAEGPSAVAGFLIQAEAGDTFAERSHQFGGPPALCLQPVLQIPCLDRADAHGIGDKGAADTAARGAAPAFSLQLPHVLPQECTPCLRGGEGKGMNPHG